MNSGIAIVLTKLIRLYANTSFVGLSSPRTKSLGADPVLKRLGDAVRQFVNDGLAPDVVAITGDIAHSGNNKDYDQAKLWIDNQFEPVSLVAPRTEPSRSLR